jgi:hypothetical protein
VQNLPESNVSMLVSLFTTKFSKYTSWITIIVIAIESGQVYDNGNIGIVFHVMSIDIKYNVTLDVYTLIYNVNTEVSIEHIV